ncbi:MAG: hypothetical protein NT175_04195 [Bacteroidetes bacterium]|nr:hypothetical protein [Bacteroidota bacterium]
MYKKERFRTDFLFPAPSFFKGLASIFNVPGNYYDFNYSQSNEEADYKALKTDWSIIGQDIRNAVDNMGQQTTLKKDKQLELNFNE